MPDASMIVFRCACGQKLRATPARAGLEFKCPTCGAQVHVPRSGTSTAPQAPPVPRNVFSPAKPEILLHPVHNDVQVRALSRRGWHAIVALGAATVCPIVAVQVTEAARGAVGGWAALIGAAMLLAFALWLTAAYSALHGLIALRLWILESGVGKDERHLQLAISCGVGILALFGVAAARSANFEVAWLGGYMCIAGAASILAMWRERRRLRQRKWIWGTAIVAATLLIGVDHSTARYVRKWTSDSGIDYVDTYNRSHEIVWRSLRKPREGTLLPAWSSEGAMVPSGKPHGQWETTTWEPFDMTREWFWYGEAVSEGEFVLRSRR
jgi:predicted RNA-binding Zn-ribbon protein involved in translation (DUF1610 family)